MKMEYLEIFYMENKALWYKQNFFFFTTYVLGMRLLCNCKSLKDRLLL